MTEELAAKLLDQAEDLICSNASPDSLLEILEEAEKLYSDDVSVLCRCARILFRYAIYNGTGRCLLLALDKIKMAEEKNPLFFDRHPLWWQLWGNILIQLGKLVEDESLFETALEKYQRASKVTKNFDLELSWDWAEAWILLAQRSGELTDYQQGIAKFYQTYQAGLNSPFFRLDYANALVLYGKLNGNSIIIEEGISLYRTVISDTYRSNEEPSIAYLVAWKKMALALKMRYQFTHSKAAFEEADLALKEAILASPKNGDLWMDWAEFFLYAGWLKRDYKLIEMGLDKLTSTKIRECEPLRVSYLLSLGLVIFGIFMENLKLLKEGQERARSAQELAKHHPQLGFACAFADLGMGLYFSDETLLAQAAAAFEKKYEEDPLYTHQNLHALFQTYLAWGMHSHESFLVEKGIKAISRLCKLVPFSPVHLNEWGVAILRLRQFKEDKEQQQACIEEAIDKFAKAWELSEDDETLYNWGCALDLLGDLTADEEDYAKAIDLLTKVYEKKSSELPVRYHLGVAFSHLGELTLNADCLNQAVELLESVAKSDSEDENVWCDLGYTLLNLSELLSDATCSEDSEKLKRDAEKALLRAAELGSGDACYHLACLYSLSGLYDASMRYLKRAEAIDYLPPKEDLEHDEWLDGVRKTDAFQDFLTSQGENG